MEQQKQEFVAESAESKSIETISRKEAKALGLKRYFTGKACKRGHVAERFVSVGKCCVCVAERDRKYHEQNKEKVSEYKRKYYEQNKDKLAEQNRKYYEKNKEKFAEYREQNKDKFVEYRRKYRKANPEQQFIRRSIERIQDNWKGGRAEAEKILGYTCEQLEQHIESKFKDGMSWENRSEWHIDHIKPVSAFIKEGLADPAVVNALDNLQPLWAKENFLKGAKYNAKDS